MENKQPIVQEAVAQGKAILWFPWALGWIQVEGHNTGMTRIGFAAVEHNPPTGCPLKSPSHYLWLSGILNWLQAYFKSPLQPPKLPLELNGTPFQKKVWKAISHVPLGQTRTYGDIANQMGQSCAQAVGTACGANPFPLVIPCHRVVAKNGLGGFSRKKEGPELSQKQWLLSHESAL